MGNLLKAFSNSSRDGKLCDASCSDLMLKEVAEEEDGEMGDARLARLVRRLELERVVKDEGPGEGGPKLDGGTNSYCCDVGEIATDMEAALGLWARFMAGSAIPASLSARNRSCMDPPGCEGSLVAASRSGECCGWGLCEGQPVSARETTAECERTSVPNRGISQTSLDLVHGGLGIDLLLWTGGMRER